MRARSCELSWMFLVLALLTVNSGCQYLSGPLARFQKKNTRPNREIARGPMGPMQASSFTNTSPTSEQKADVRIAFARTVEGEGDHQGAMKLYQQIIQSAPDHPDAYHRLAVLHDQDGNHAEALQYYEEALKRDPHNAELYADRGYSFYLQNQWPAAEENLRQALQLDRSLARAHNNLGLLLARTGRQDEAMMEFQLAGCSEPECRANLVHALMLDQRYSEAQQQCEIVLASHAAPAEVERRLKRLNARIAEARQAQPSAPPQSQFLPTGAEPAVPRGLLAPAQRVSYESAHDFKALPPVVPTTVPPVPQPSTGMFHAPSMQPR